MLWDLNEGKRLYQLDAGVQRILFKHCFALYDCACVAVLCGRLAVRGAAVCWRGGRQRMYFPAWERWPGRPRARNVTCKVACSAS